MGLYIKGLDMPIVCADCYCCISEPDTMPRCALTHGSMCVMECNNQRLADCPLVEVKEPHGRLIDENAVMREFELRDRTNGKVLMDYLLGAPTVLEAEGNDED